jgi:hypothetical protein
LILSEARCKQRGSIVFFVALLDMQKLANYNARFIVPDPAAATAA